MLLDWECWNVTVVAVVRRWRLIKWIFTRPRGRVSDGLKVVLSSCAETKWLLLIVLVILFATSPFLFQVLHGQFGNDLASFLDEPQIAWARCLVVCGRPIPQTFVILSCQIVKDAKCLKTKWACGVSCSLRLHPIRKHETSPFKVPLGGCSYFSARLACHLTHTTHTHACTWIHHDLLPTCLLTFHYCFYFELMTSFWSLCFCARSLYVSGPIRTYVTLGGLPIELAFM